MYGCGVTIGNVIYYGILCVFNGSAFYAQLLLSASNILYRRSDNQYSKVWLSWKFVTFDN